MKYYVQLIKLFSNAAGALWRCRAVACLFLVFCSCNNTSHPKRNEATFVNATKSAVASEVTRETMLAGELLKRLHIEGRLPGDSKDEHGILTSDVVSVPKAYAEAYPMVRTFHLVKAGESLTNHYEVERLSKESSWKLRRAWRTDLNGMVIDNWPVE